jgi:hypothetical protein
MDLRRHLSSHGCRAKYFIPPGEDPGLLSARVAENARICDQRDLLRGFRSLRG